jgi:tetratricopeptide (TPR) repeat protein
VASDRRRAFRILCAALLLAGALRVESQQGLGIDLSGPSKKKGEPKKAEPAPAPSPPAAKPAAPLTFEAITVSGRSAGKQRMDAAKKLYQEKAYESAALAFHEILRDKALAEDHDEARYQLAKSLARLGLYHSALTHFQEILGKGPQGTKYFLNALDGMFYVGRRLANDQVIYAQVARFAGESIPPAFQDKFHYLLARYNFERGRALAEAGQSAEAGKAYEETRRLAGRVKAAGAPPPPGGEVEESGDDGDLYARARFLEGLVLYAQGNQAAALESFKEVVRRTNPRRTTRPDPRLREAAFLQLARIHYEHKQNRYAIFYYSKMPWGEPLWLEGLWESSYAYYRIGDYEKSLGNLLTLHSPYFKDEYFPESYVLKAIIYYENCRYPEARAILEDFNSTYEPVYAELKALTARGGSPASYYELIERTEKSRDPAQRASLMRKVMKIAFTDKAIKRLNDSILEIENEMDEGIGRRREALRASALAAESLAALKAQRARLVDEAGARARQKLEFERDALRELLEQALRIKIEVSRKEREALEVALAKGAPVDVVRRYSFSAAVSDEHEYWPYQGEFWRDELGTYSYTLTRGCREGPGRPAAR